MRTFQWRNELILKWDQTFGGKPKCWEQHLQLQMNPTLSRYGNLLSPSSDLPSNKWWQNIINNNKSTTRRLGERKKVERPKLTCSCQSLVPNGAWCWPFWFPSANWTLCCHKRLDGRLGVPFGHREALGVMGVAVFRREFSSRSRVNALLWEENVKEEVHTSDVHTVIFTPLIPVKFC